MPKNILAQLKALNQNLTLNQKLSITALAAVILSSILFFVYMMNREPFQLLFSDLDAQSVSPILDKLKERNIPYEMSQGGRSLSVPADRVNEARIALASDGLPQQGRLGFELFDQQNWGLTDFAEKVNYRRALEGELERSISSLKEIARARVHLVMEKQTLFEEDKEPAKASVVIELRGGARLAASHVRGITNLVAFAVAGLRPENVTVVDVGGRLLSQRSEEESLGSGLMEARKAMEQDLAKKVVSLLEPLVGQDKVRVSASVVLDNTETQQTEELVDPNRTALVRQRKTDEAVTGNLVGGIPFKANDQSNPQQSSAEGRKLVQEEVHYDVSKTIRNTVLPRGSLKQISVAVVIDDKSVRETDARGRVIEKSEPREAEEMARLHKLVSATIGFDQKRGDVLSVENVAFSTQVEQPLAPVGWLERYQREFKLVLKYLRIVALFLLFYFFIFRPVKRKVFSYIEVSEPDLAQLEAATGDREMVRQLKAKIESGQSDTPLFLGDGEESSSTRMKVKKLVSLANDEPEMVTKLIRSWLAEGS
ncbi:MAG: flagellar basal-body MS-ring/collar protein FliF [Acidobacteriota bacterium]